MSDRACLILPHSDNSARLSGNLGSRTQPPIVRSRPSVSHDRLLWGDLGTRGSGDLWTLLGYGACIVTLHEEEYGRRDVL